jgi:hypothetical protein
MTIGEIGNEGLRLISQATGTAAAVSAVTGYVALGAAVLVARSLLDMARQTRETRVAGRRRPRRPATWRAQGSVDQSRSADRPLGGWI